jgi:hypothetical protein
MADVPFHVRALMSGGHVSAIPSSLACPSTLLMKPDVLEDEIRALIQRMHFSCRSEVLELGRCRAMSSTFATPKICDA